MSLYTLCFKVSTWLSTIASVLHGLIKFLQIACNFDPPDHDDFDFDEPESADAQPKQDTSETSQSTSSGVDDSAPPEPPKSIRPELLKSIQPELPQSIKPEEGCSEDQLRLQSTYNLRHRGRRGRIDRAAYRLRWNLDGFRMPKIVEEPELEEEEEREVSNYSTLKSIEWGALVQ